jgi:chemotaxis protein CheY-P-specific phosphatase CheC
MAGPKLEMALQGLQDAINELDSTIVTTASKFRDTASQTMSPDSELPKEMLRAELQALRQMISQANALIGGASATSKDTDTDEVLH